MIFGIEEDDIDDIEDIDEDENYETEIKLTSNSENERIDLYISKNVSDMSRNSIRNP
jgi:hypothetical protein